jgi:arylsulfatase A-like enzyme
MLGQRRFRAPSWLRRYLGGTRTPLVISWPAKIKHDGKVRSQFHHVNDIAATIYDILDITPPKVVNGIEQQPLDGISMVYTFDNPEAKTTKTTQYFESSAAVVSTMKVGLQELLALEHHGLMRWPVFWTGNLRTMYGSCTTWKNDYSQSKDLAKENPEKLAELKAVFDKEATENLVYPIGAGLYGMYYDTTALPSFPYTEWSFYEGQTRIPEGWRPNL